MDGIFHRFCHGNRILCTGDRSIHEYRISAVLHRQGRIGCRPHTRIDDDRHLDGFHDNFQVVRITDPKA